MAFENLKYESSMVTFLEVPDEVSLCINISGCPCHCENCSEPWLKDDLGELLDCAATLALLQKHPHITCICFMGGDRHPDKLAQLIHELREQNIHLKMAMYSGRSKMNQQLSECLDYYKIGPYIEFYGPLNKKTTNQIFYKKENNQWVDITYRFQKEEI